MKVRWIDCAAAIAVSAALAGCGAVQDPSVRLAGVWQLTGPDGELGECPDIIGFEPDGDYMVWNECYGEDPDNPLVETGTWRFADAVRLQLTDRAHLIGVESPWGDSPELELRIVELSSGTLSFAVGGGVETVERYQRVEAN